MSFPIKLSLFLLGFGILLGNFYPKLSVFLVVSAIVAAQFIEE